MQGLKRFLLEDKNTHLEHLEDEIINNGSRGAKNSIEFLKSIKKMLQGGKGGSNVSVKWDGAPAIFAGINPENDRFFVGTKSIFNATPKINYTVSDISRNHGGALADKLAVALKYLPSLGIKGVLQGDLLFTDDKKNAVVNGEKSIIFTPNTITYAVPTTSVDMYNRIRAAKIGIIFHTSYRGKTMRGLKASFGASVGGLRQSRSVFFDDARYRQSEDPGLSKGEEKRFDAIIRMAEGSVYKAGTFIDKIKKDKGPLSLGVQLKTFFNTYIRSGTKIGNAKALTNNFEVFFIDRLKKEIDGKKQDKTKQKYKEILEAGMKILRPNRQGLYFTIATYITLQTAKSMLLSKLNRIQSIGSFMRTPTGYKATNPEGYVAINKGNAVKLVDRLVFSQANFNVAKDWVRG